jgi:hypothetical protein
MKPAPADDDRNDLLLRHKSQLAIVEEFTRKAEGKELWAKFTIAMDCLLKIAPDRFHLLEGLTKESGQVLFVSADRRKIENSGDTTKSIRLKNGDWYINASGGQHDFEVIIDRCQKILALSPGIVEEIKRKTIFLQDPKSIYV